MELMLHKVEFLNLSSKLSIEVVGKTWLGPQDSADLVMFSIGKRYYVTSCALTLHASVRTLIALLLKLVGCAYDWKKRKK